MGKIDKWILLSVVILVSFGLFNLFGIRSDLVLQQSLFVAVGFILFIVFFKFGPGLIRSNVILIYVVMTSLLIFVSLVSPAVRGSSRWIDLYFFKLQPSEFFRPFFLSILTHVFARKLRDKSSQEFFKAIFLAIPPIVLILHQPDLGNAILYAIILMSVLYYVGITLKFFIGMFLFGIVSLPVVWQFLHQYQRLRVISFLNPEVSPQGVSYNLIQSIITVGSGQLFGKGLGLGTQSRYQFLPEFHTDFAYASLVEQFGFIGGAVVLLCFAIITFRLIRHALNKKDDLYSFLFLLGSATILFASVMVNIGMNMGILPVTGVALPFISYGGSSVLSTFILLGMAMGLL